MIESLLIWGLTLGTCAGIVGFYVWRVQRGLRRDLADHVEAKELGIDKPRAQHPQVDLSRCIGCGACIAACPEGGVLGMIQGKAAIISGLRCVGHGRCAEACPVEAVTIGMGDVGHRADLPRLDPEFQTNVPGLYVVGELGGLALIRNAIQQGTQAARAIAAFCQQHPRPPEVEADLVIVGAGPAGMATAVEAYRLGLKPLLLDQHATGGTILKYPRKKLVLTQPVEIPLYGWLRKPEYTKEALLEIWQQTLAKAELTIRTGTRVLDVLAEPHRFRVETERGEVYGRSVVLAMGRTGTPRRLDVPGEDERKVFYQLVDAAQFQADHLLVVGGGDSAVEAAIALGCQPGNTVTLSYRKQTFFRIKRRNRERLDAALKAKQIHLITQSDVLEIRPTEVVLQTPSGPITLPNDYVFAFTGGIPPFELLRRAGIAFGREEVAS